MEKHLHIDWLQPKMQESKNNILITTSSFGEGNPEIIDHIKWKGFDVILNSYCRKLTEGELVELMSEYRPVGLLAGLEPITRTVLEKVRDYLKVISRVGVGLDNVDRVAANELGIQVFRTGGVLSQAVAELTLGMILSALRAIPSQCKQVCSGVWEKGMGKLLQGKVVGIIGFGAIGQRVGELVLAFGAKVLYHDPIPGRVKWGKPVSMHNLLSQADIVTIHANGLDQILGEKELNSLCKPGVMIVNMARGSLVDETALCKALESGQVSYACLDVFEKEPYSGRLTQFKNVILTPHIGSYAKEARIEMEKMAVENLLEGLKVLGEAF